MRSKPWAASGWPAGSITGPVSSPAASNNASPSHAALVTEPDLILADEPTGNLDSGSAAEVMRLMGELHEAGRTLVLITHDADVASAAGRVIGIRDGLLSERDESHLESQSVR